MIKDPVLLPAVALRGLVVFPYMMIQFEAARAASLSALEYAMSTDQLVFLVAQKELRIEHPTRGDLYDVGVVAKVRHILRMPGDLCRVMVEGLYRARLVNMYDGEYIRPK